MSTGVSEINKLIARHVATQFGGGRPQVDRFWDDDHRFSLDLVSSVDKPEIGSTSYGTIGFSGFPVLLNAHDKTRLPVELVGACNSSKPEFGNALVSAAFYTIRHDWRCVPGSVLENALDMYALSRTMKHFLFTSPFLWEGLDKASLGERTVHWLMAIPISDAEHRYLTTHGDEALEMELEKRDVDILDIDRPSIF